jgi:hypothetical protein
MHSTCLLLIAGHSTEALISMYSSTEIEFEYSIFIKTLSHKQITA